MGGKLSKRFARLGAAAYLAIARRADAKRRAIFSGARLTRAARQTTDNCAMKIRVHPLLAVLSVSLIASTATAQKIENLFGGKATIQVPAGAQFAQEDTPWGNQYAIFFDESGDRVSVGEYKLPKAKRNWNDAKWRKDRASYYSNPKNKKKYKFKHINIEPAGNRIVIEYQSTFKSRGKRVISRAITKDIRVDKGTVLTARFYTTPSRWKNNDSERLRAVVRTLTAQ